ncbi:energy-coupling factor transporter transmembrane protein EcfT [Paenibacillus alvei]|uniref:Energy-coupling factor transporter transmembrane protein EcfT n=1 Tax=Paenibacillus alvei TaxID=44250 RepID=A0AAP7DI05_PAEAL|nr:energy-coupling factor transporter transmembrane component T [Paenibacillus alvei]MCY9543422.1 energy-coupling factor transporter transmembrane protein EcfT [Paenibacillus alvei]MCY9704508.1 energy-coupling factor transporter transmembrane protein EcfT [Paenibacillus alvei]MCY9732832.1 energy-coupling factor transporter transmembrane protein EcfT [Paenibacillus alvei]MCY9754848.1 energy-coupling factor transporter transmembrane protein EcfT [Paenibacillus alvei]MEC0079565.1 energy-coupling 
MNLLAPKSETWLHRVNPAIKLVVFIILLLVALLNRQLDFALYQLVLYTLLLFLCSGHSKTKLLLLTLPFLFLFVSTASTMILFGKGEHVWWSWGLIRISEESFYRGLVIGVKTLCFGMLGLTFAFTTKPILLFYALMQQFRLPPQYAYSFIASLRLLPAIWEDYRTRSHALQIRGVRYKSGWRGIFERLHTYALPLLAQSIRRAQRVAVAMEAKRFQMNKSRTYFYITRYHSIDLAFVLLVFTLVTAIFLLSLRFPLFHLVY